jgi:AcrR family transcriptional regulator
MSAMAATHDLDRLIDAALALAERRGWRELALADIAREAGLPLARVHGLAPSKTAILEAHMRRTDAAVLSGAPADPGSDARDRLFDAVMRRFDAMAPGKAGLRAIVHDLSSDPAGALCLGPGLMRAMAWTLEAAGIDSGGWRGRLKAKGLALLYLSVLRVWLGDDSAEQSKTMAALDRGLRRAEQAFRFCEDFARWTARQGTATEPQAADSPPPTRSRKVKKKKKNKKL